MAENIVANRTAGLQLVGQTQLVQQKAEAAIAQIEADNAQAATDLAAIAGADLTTLKQILGRVIQGLVRSNNRQKRIIQYLTR